MCREMLIEKINMRRQNKLRLYWLKMNMNHKEYKRLITYNLISKNKRNKNTKELIKL